MSVPSGHIGAGRVRIGSLPGVGGSDPLPDDIPGLALWLKADAISGVAHDAAVSTWHDSSTNARNFTNSTVGEQPIFTTGAVNGLPAVRFSSVSSHHLQRSSGFLTGASGAFFAVMKSSVSTDAASHYLMTARSTATGTTQFMGLGFKPANLQVLRIVENSSGGGATTGPDIVTGTAVVTTNAYQILHQRSNGSSYHQQVNGADDALTVVGGANSGDWFGDQSNLHNVTLSGDSSAAGSLVSPFSGHVAEVIVYDGVSLTTSQVRQVTAYLGSKYGINV